jgi:SNF2 family DNA or RNA helicase
LSLPPKTERVETIELSPVERKLYNLLAVTGHQRYETLIKEDRLNQMIIFIMEMITRMRQACTDSSLVPTRYWNDGFAKSSYDDLILARGMLDRLLDALRGDEDVECCICMDKQVNCITRCSHIFCTSCLDRMLVNAGRRGVNCPMCRGHVTVNDIVDVSMQRDIEKREAEAAVDAEAAKKRMEGGEIVERSSKMKALVRMLLKDKNSQEKRIRRRKNGINGQSVSSFLELIELLLQWSSANGRRCLTVLS